MYFTSGDQFFDFHTLQDHEVGDTTSDLVAGTRSGALVVAGVLTGAHSAEELAEAPHTHLLASVQELPGLLLG